MASIFELRNMWRDALNRKKITINDLDADTKALITSYETKETAYKAKVAAYETAKTTADTLNRELMNDRSDMMISDSKINFAIMSYTQEAPLTPPLNP